MKMVLAFMLLLSHVTAFANTWTYQVNVNGNQSPAKIMDSAKNSFDAGPYYCEVTPVTLRDKTEYRSLVCSVGSGTVSTGGLCTQKKAKFASVQYAILNLAGPKDIVNVVVACKFD